MRVIWIHLVPLACEVLRVFPNPERFKTCYVEDWDERIKKVDRDCPALLFWWCVGVFQDAHCHAATRKAYKPSSATEAKDNPVCQYIACVANFCREFSPFCMRMGHWATFLPAKHSCGLRQWFVRTLSSWTSHHSCPASPMSNWHVSTLIARKKLPMAKQPAVCVLGCNIEEGTSALALELSFEWITKGG